MAQNDKCWMRVTNLYSANSELHCSPAPWSLLTGAGRSGNANGPHTYTVHDTTYHAHTAMR